MDDGGAPRIFLHVYYFSMYPACHLTYTEDQCSGSGIFIPIVADPGCLSRIRLFPIPDPNCLHPGSASKNLSILTPKKWFPNSRKYDPGCSSRIPYPDADFLPIPDPQHCLSRIPGQKDIRIRIIEFTNFI
jgi:hypothetical protein